MNDEIKALADRLLAIEARLSALEDDREPVEAVPVWRQMVDAASKGLPKKPQRLSWLFASLSDIAWPDAGQEETAQSLAGIVAVCEAEVGDGWKADPDASSINPDLMSLIYWLNPGTDRPHYDVMGRIAARWLRDLTEEQS